MAASFTTSVVRSTCSDEKAGPCIDLGDLSSLIGASTFSLTYGPSKLKGNGCDSSLRRRFCHHAQVPLPQADHHQLPRREDADVPEVARQAGVDARRERPREVR